MIRWVKFEWPDRFRGDPRRIAEGAGLRARHRDGAWQLTTEDGYYRRRPRLLTMDHVVSPGQPPGERARQVIDGWEPLQNRTSGMDDRAADHINELLHADSEEAPTIAEYLEAHRLLLMLMPDKEVFDWLAGVVAALGQSLPDYRVALLNHSHAVHSRVAFVRALFSKDHAPEWIAEGKDFEGFNAMRGLFGDAFQGNSTFINPLLAVRAPWIIGSALVRPPSGMAILLFGHPQMGRHPVKHASLSEAVTTSYLAATPHIRTPATPQLDVDDILESLRWWVRGANRLMSVALDPTLFADKNGWYQPALHMGYLVSIDRLLASSIALLVQSGVDEYSRRIHLFQILDLLEGLGIGDYQKTLNPERTAGYIEELKQSMPEPVQRILLARCEAAQTGLEALWRGFHQSRTVEGTLWVTTKKGAVDKLSPGTATSRYLRTLRNAGHTLTKELRDPAKLALLAAHNGEIHPDVSDAAFLHLVRLIADPGLLERPRVGG